MYFPFVVGEGDILSLKIFCDFWFLVTAAEQIGLLWAKWAKWAIWPTGAGPGILIHDGNLWLVYLVSRRHDKRPGSVDVLSILTNSAADSETHRWAHAIAFER